MPEIRDEQIEALAELIGQATYEPVEMHDHTMHADGNYDPACPTCVARCVLDAGYVRVDLDEAIERLAREHYGVDWDMSDEDYRDYWSDRLRPIVLAALGRTSEDIHA